MKNQNLVKLILTLLLISLIISTFVSCGNSTKNENTTTAETDTGEAIQFDKWGRQKLSCNVIESKCDFAAQEVHILAQEDRKFETYDANETPGNALNEALYMRNMNVEGNINVEIVYEYSEMGGGAKTILAKIRSAWTAGDPNGGYDIILPHAYYSTGLVSEGVCTNLLKQNYLDFEKPWWNANMNAEMTINNQLYIGIGDFALSSIRNTFALFYNKTLLENYTNENENIYDIVDNKQWTIEKMKSLVKDVYTDQDEIQGKSAGDIYGYVTTGHAFNTDAFFAGFNVKITERNDDELMVISLGDQHSVNAFNATKSLFFLEETYYVGSSGDDMKKVREMFSTSNALFVSDMFCATETFAKKMDGYGILPMPLLDETQGNYASTSQEGFSAIIVPSNIVDDRLERATATLECLCYKSYEEIVPLYYEVNLKLRYSKQEADAKIYDLILENRYYNFGYLYSHVLGDPLWTWRNNLRSAEGKSISTIWSESIPTYKQELKDLLQYFELAE